MIQISAQFLVSACLILLVVHAMLGATAYLIMLERKVAAWAQDRIGPNRTGFSFGQDNIWKKLRLGFMTRFRFLGLGQALADGIKLFFKEDYTPPHVDKILFTLAPALIMIPAMIAWAVIPWGGDWIIGSAAIWTDPFGLVTVTGLNEAVQVTALPIHLGVIYVLAVGSIGVYGMTIGSYASNNKFAFLGGMRATAQMLAYEIPMGLVLLLMMMYYRSGDLSVIVHQQISGAWGILSHPLLAIVLYACMLAETNRAPFDLAEAEQELVGGFHTEYGSMRWALYFLGEYMHMIAGAAFFAVLFLGGWDVLPFINLFGDGIATAWGGLLLVALKMMVLAGKVIFLVFLSMWIRWSIPRLRFDQLMNLAWVSIIPMMLVALLIGTLIAAVAHHVRLLPLNGFWVYTLADGVTLAIVIAVTPFVRKRCKPINRRVPLAGSRFSPLTQDENQAATSV